MPGFVINGTGNQYPIPNTLETVRANRFIIEILGPITLREHLVVAKDFQIPKWTATKQEIPTTLMYKYAKGVNWGDASITFYDTMDPPILDSLNEWKDLVYSITNGIGVHGSGGYKQDTVLNELDGEGGIIRRIRLKNSWPVDVDFGKLSYADSNINLVNLSLSVDYVLFE